MRASERCAAACAFALVCLIEGAGGAQPAAAPDPALGAGESADARSDPDGVDVPWARGVSPAERREAQRLFREGTALMQKTLFAQAAEKYQQALAHWDLPAIHYNLAIARFNLAQDLSAYHSVQRALRHGEAALGAARYRDAQRLEAQLESRLARLTVRCDEPGARVTLDGAPLLVGPGRETALVAAGEHQVAAEKPGFYSELIRVAVSSGDDEQVAIALVSTEPVTARRWTWWKPWVAAGSGLGAIAVGGLVHAISVNNYNEFDDGFHDLDCASEAPSGSAPRTEGCRSLDPALGGRLAGAERQRTAALVLYAAGSAALATGVVMLYLNRARVVRRADRAASISFDPIVSPILSGDMVGAAVTLGF